MVSRTAILRLQLVDAVSGPSRGVAASLRGVDTALSRFGKSGTPEVKRLVKQLEYLQKKAGAIGSFQETRRGLRETGAALKDARTHVQRLEQALASATKPTKKMEAELRSARNTLKATTTSFREQMQAVKASERSLRSYSLAGRTSITNSQKEMRNQIAQTIRKMRELDREQRNPPRPPRSSRMPGGGGGGIGSMVVGGAVANAGRNAAGRAFDFGVSFDQAAAYQAALGGYGDGDRKTLNRQAEKIGGDTRFSNVDVVQAQTTILQGGIKDVKTIMDLTAKVTDYALAMGVTLEEGAETVRGSALSKRVNLSDANEIGKFVDNLVWMAKNGGMNDEDVRQYMKYGGASTTGAKLPDEVSAAMGMILRRSGVRGDEAGVFARSATSKLVAPTKKGRDSLAAMGIDYNDFTTMPDAMNDKGIGIMMKNNFGVRMTDAMKTAVKELMESGEFTDPETGETRSVGSDSGEFVTQMSNILAPLFGGDKMSVQDAKALSKGLADYHKYSVESVDAVGLLNAIMSKNPGLGNLNAFFTDKQGGRANMIAQQYPLFQQMVEMMRNTPGGVANKIGTKANEGLYGDYTKLTGTVETALTRISQDWEFATRPIINTTNDVIDGFIGLSESTRRLIEAFAGGVAVFAGVAAFKSATGLIGGMLGGKKGGARVGGAPAGGPKGGRFAGALGNFGLPLAVLTTLGRGSVLNDEKTKSDVRRRLEEQKANAARSSSAASSRSGAASPLQGDLAQATVQWPFAAQQAMREYVAALTNGGAQAQAEANRIGSEIETQLNIVANPDVNTGRLERALGIARQLASVLRGEAGGVSAGAGLPPSISDTTVGGPRARGGRIEAGKTYAIGNELVTPNSNGYVHRAGAGGGGGAPQITNHFHLKGDNARSQAQEIARIITSQLSRSEQTVFSGMQYGDV